jgi:hypothetical protein
LPEGAVTDPSVDPSHRGVLPHTSSLTGLPERRHCLTLPLHVFGEISYRKPFRHHRSVSPSQAPGGRRGTREPLAKLDTRSRPAHDNHEPQPIASRYSLTYAVALLPVAKVGDIAFVASLDRIARIG